MSFYVLKHLEKERTKTDFVYQWVFEAAVDSDLTPTYGLELHVVPNISYFSVSLNRR